MEEQTLMSREVIEGHLIETFEAENTAGFSVSFIDMDNVEIDYDDVPVPGEA